MDLSLTPPNRLYRVVVSRVETHERLDSSGHEEMATHTHPIKSYLVYGEVSETGAVNKIKERLYPTAELQVGREFRATQVRNVPSIDDVFEE